MPFGNLAIVDAETSGLNPQIHGLLSLGAVDYNTGDEFYEECALSSNKMYTDEALSINGFKSDKIKQGQSSVELILKFETWRKARDIEILGGENPGFDIGFLKAAYATAGLDWPFHHRSVDIHSINFAIHRAFGVEMPENGLNLDKTLESVGLEPEPKPHNALTGAKLEAIALKRLIDMIGEPNH